MAAFDTTDGLSRDHEYSILRSGGASVTDQDTDTAAPFFFKLNVVLRPQKPEGSLGRTAQNGHLDSHTAPELCLAHRYDAQSYMF